MSESRQGIDNLAFSKDSRLEIAEKIQSIRLQDNHKQRNREKCLCFFLILFLLAIVGLVVAVVKVAKTDVTEPFPGTYQTSENSKTEVCLTHDCVQAAARIAESMDKSVNPCDDFYTYACGVWKQKNIIPEDKSDQSVFWMLIEQVAVINKYLLEDVNAYKDVEAIQKVKDMYAGCIDVARINEKNETVAVPFLNDLGGWPVLGSNDGGNWNESDFSLVQLLVTLRKYNFAPVITMYVSSDVKDSENHIIYLDQPNFGMPGRLYYLDPDLEHMREAYVKLAFSVAVLFGSDQGTAELEMREMMRLETELANISMPSEERRDTEALYNKMTISELERNFSVSGPPYNVHFNWFEYLNGIMDLDDVKVPINESEYVVVRSVPYFQKLLPVLQKYDKRVIANYLVWNTMKYMSSNLDDRFKDLLSDYEKIVYGIQRAGPRWNTCVRYVVRQMGMAVGHMFIRETFDASAKLATLEMINNIRAAFSELLEELDWMDSKTKQLAREKMEAMKSWIGYPDDIIEPEYINRLYENVTVDRTEHFNNVLNNLKRTASSRLRVLRQKYDKNIWTTPPSIVNAYYSHILNNIMFPAGILQPPLYSKDQPKAMNYGAIGMAIGHEITHGFDDRGRQYDKDGNLIQWWEAGIIDNFKEKAQCFIDQYGKYVVPGVNLTLNGINTQGENIADNGGLKQSFRAYRRWVERRGSEEPMLPGLNFTGNQLFFISYAQLWCNNARKESTIDDINNGVHSPGQFRVIGPLQNSKDFSEAFRCNNNHYMNPPTKCYVW